MKKACVIGWPIKHSRSPLIHNFWLRRYDIEGRYDRRAIAPEDLETFLASMVDQDLQGCNVTVPHKENVYRLVTVEDPLANRLGAVNTVYRRNDELLGTNTDGIGFLRNLKTGNPKWRADSGPAMVLGAGGAARAVLAVLLEEGVSEIRLANRTRERAEELAVMFRPRISVVDWDRREDLLRECDLLVNTTSLGMTGAPPLDMDLASLPETATVNDIVYAPLKTRLLAAAEARGNPAVDGLGMLLHQAAPGFALWFGKMPEVSDDLRALIVKDLEAEQC